MFVSLNNIQDNQFSVALDNNVSTTVDELQGYQVDDKGFIDQVMSSATPYHNIMGMVSNTLDSISTNHQIINNTLKNGVLHSPAEALDIQESISQFTLSTQLFSKSVSTLVKDIDTLTRIQ